MRCGFSSCSQMELRFLIPRLTYFSFYPLFFTEEEQVGLLGFHTLASNFPIPGVLILFLILS